MRQWIIHNFYIPSLYIVQNTVNKILQLVLHVVSDKSDLQRVPKMLLPLMSALTREFLTLTSETFLLKKLYVGLVISWLLLQYCWWVSWHLFLLFSERLPSYWFFSSEVLFWYCSFSGLGFRSYEPIDKSSLDRFHTGQCTLLFNLVISCLILPNNFLILLSTGREQMESCAHRWISHRTIAQIPTVKL